MGSALLTIQHLCMFVLDFTAKWFFNDISSYKELLQSIWHIIEVVILHLIWLIIWHITL